MQECGAYIIDADVLARKALEPGGEGERQIKKAFPEAFEGGRLDRKKLRSIAFADPAKAAALDGITHPIIVRLIEEELERSKLGNKLTVLVVPLLFETGLQRLCDYTVQISADRNLRIKRATERDNVTIEGVEAIIARQLPDAERERLADRVVYNNGGLDDLKKQLLTVTNINYKI